MKNVTAASLVSLSSSGTAWTAANAHYLETENWVNGEFARIRKDIDALDDAERLQFNAICQRYLRVWEQAHYQFTEGHLDSQMWESIHETYVDLMGEKAIQSVWEVRKHAYRKSFRDYVGGLTFRSYELR